MGGVRFTGEALGQSAASPPPRLSFLRRRLHTQNELGQYPEGFSVGVLQHGRRSSHRESSRSRRRRRCLLTKQSVINTIRNPLPNSHPVVVIVDLLTMACLAITATLTAFEVGFVPLNTPGWFELNRCVDVVFLLDMLVQFRTKQPADTARQKEHHKGGTAAQAASRAMNGALDTAAGMRRELKRTSTTAFETSAQNVNTVVGRRIALRYCLSDFPFDLLALLCGFVPDMVGRTLASSLDGQDIKLVKSLRFIRLFRLTKAAVLYSRMLNRYQARFELNFAMLTVINCLVMYIITAHFLACILGLTAALASSTGVDTWLGYQSYCLPMASREEAEAAVAPAPWGIPKYRGWTVVYEGETGLSVADAAAAEASVAVCAPAFEAWFGCYLWMIMVIAGLSGFDPSHGSYSGMGEQAVMLFVAVCAALLWSHIIGTFASVLSSLDPEGSLFKQRMDALNRFCRDHSLDQHTRYHLRQYLIETRQIQVAEANQTLLELFTPQLQGNIAYQINKSWMGRIPFLRNVERECWIQLAMEMKPMVLMAGELAPGGCLYVIHRGVVMHRTYVLTRGETWGSDVILAKFELRRWSGRALTIAEVHFLRRKDLMRIVDSFPEAESSVRWAAIRMALIRTLLAQAEARDAADADKDGKLDFGEFCAMVREREAREGDGRSYTEAELRARFRALDEDGSGKVDMDEYIKAQAKGIESSSQGGGTEESARMSSRRRRGSSNANGSCDGDSGSSRRRDAREGGGVSKYKPPPKAKGKNFMLIERLGETSAVNPAEEGGRKQNSSDGVFAIQATLALQEQRTISRMEVLERNAAAQGKRLEGALGALSRVERALAVLTAGMGARGYDEISAEPSSPPPLTPAQKASKVAKRHHRRSLPGVARASSTDDPGEGGGDSHHRV